MIHSLAEVHTDKICEGIRIWQFCVILLGIKIMVNEAIQYLLAS